MKRQHLGLALLASLSLASCNQTAAPGQSLAAAPQDTPAAFRNSVDIPLAVGQAMALKSLAMSGNLSAQSVDILDVASTLVEDFDGRPFYHLTLSTKGNPADTDFWHLVKTAKSRDDIVTATGANTSRTMFAFQFDEVFTSDLRDTLAKAGSIKRLIVPDGSVVWLQDARGRYWNVTDQTLISTEQVASAQALYQYLVRNNAGDGLADDWQPLLNDPAVSSLMSQKPGGDSQKIQFQSASTAIQNFVLADGSLDTKSYLNTLPASAFRPDDLKDSGVTVSKPGQIKPLWDVGDAAETGWFGFVNSRAGIAGSALDGAAAMTQSNNLENYQPWKTLKTYDPGNAQRALSELSIATPPGKQWALRSAVSPITEYKYDWDVTGCMGTAYARMWAALVQKNISIDYTMYMAGVYSWGEPISEQARKTVAWLSQPVQADGMPSDTVEPYITKKMGGGYFQGGTLITPPGLASGGQAVLQEKLQPVSGVTNLGVRFDGWGWANILPNVAAGSSPVTYWGITPSGMYTYNNFNMGTRYARDLVRRQMRDAGLPVAFLYGTSRQGGLAGHAALSGAYRVYEYAGGYSDVFVYLSSYKDASVDYTEGFTDSVTGWINVTNRWSSYGGVYTLSPAWKP